jgi:hypothetical protein
LKLHRLALLIILGSILTACGRSNRIPEDARAVLEHGDEFELLSLNPRLHLESAERSFHGYDVLGTIRIKDADIRKRLVSAFEKGVTENQDEIAACFNPRHGVRVTFGSRTADFVICFECAQVRVYSAAGAEHNLLISASPQAVFNQVLRDAHVPLPDG